MNPQQQTQGIEVHLNAEDVKTCNKKTSSYFEQNNVPLEALHQFFPTPSRYDCHKPLGLYSLENDLPSNKGRHATNCVYT